MDKSEGKDWFAKTLNNVTEETAKVYKISRLKLEMGTINKSRNEKLNFLGRKLVELIKDGQIESKLFEPEYSVILNTEEKASNVSAEIDSLLSTLKIGLGKRSDNNQKNKPEENKEVKEKAEDEHKAELVEK